MDNGASLLKTTSHFSVLRLRQVAAGSFIGAAYVSLLYTYNSSETEGILLHRTISIEFGVSTHDHGTRWRASTHSYTFIRSTSIKQNPTPAHLRASTSFSSS